MKGSGEACLAQLKPIKYFKKKKWKKDYGKGHVIGK